MEQVKDSLFAETSSFINNHKLLCGLTLGLAIVVYSMGNLLGRTVSWIKESCGTAKKTDSAGRTTLSKDIQPPAFNDPIIHPSTETPSPPIQPVTVEKEVRPELSPIEKKLLAAYNSPQEGWVMVPPKNELKEEQAFEVGAGAIGFNNNGRWKIHVSIDPSQIEQAIPIILEVLHSENAPRLAFKLQTKANLDSVHQIGKELAIIFGNEVEQETIQGHSKEIQNCLSLLWKKLSNAGIRPEPGLVLTPTTINEIRNAPVGSQTMEKANLERGKFDRAIPCPNNNNFFYYRDEHFAPMLDSEIGDLKGYPGVFAASEIIQLAHDNPNLAHNPTKSPDPFLNLKIQDFE